MYSIFTYSYKCGGPFKRGITRWGPFIRGLLFPLSQTIHTHTPLGDRGGGSGSGGCASRCGGCAGGLGRHGRLIDDEIPYS